jgi:molecular chaperone GrpE
MTDRNETDQRREGEKLAASQQEDSPEVKEDQPVTCSLTGEQEFHEAESSAPEAINGEAEQLLAEKEQQLAELNNRLLRLQADFDNFRRRSRQEKEEYFKYANQDLIAALLPVLDNFQRAIAANTNQDDSFAAGVNMIYKQVVEVLTRAGLEQIEAAGALFDPNLHEAVMSVESEEYGANTIIEEHQKGYRLKERVIRPSMVKVANPQ